MSKGVLIFAFNSKINYVEIATLAARLANHYLNLPVSIVTNDKTIDSQHFEKVIYQDVEGDVYNRTFKFAESRERMPWHNQNRYSAYEVSPYDQTLLIDADYLIFQPQLKELFNTNIDIACYDDVFDITGNQSLAKSAHIGFPGINMQWATVVYFTKNKTAEAVFDYMHKIKEDYEYYTNLFNFQAPLFRNDYTLSIAIQTITGYSNRHFRAIPGTLLTANTGTELVEVRSNGDLIFDYKNEKWHRIKLNKSSIHVMNKRSITNSKILKQIGEYL